MTATNMCYNFVGFMYSPPYVLNEFLLWKLYYKLKVDGPTLCALLVLRDCYPGARTKTLIG